MGFVNLREFSEAVRSVNLPKPSTKFHLLSRLFTHNKKPSPPKTASPTQGGKQRVTRIYQGLSFFFVAQHCCGIREAFCQCLGDSFFGKQGEFSFWRKSCSTWGPHIVTLAKITITSNVPFVKINFHINQVLQLLYRCFQKWGYPKIDGL